MNKDGTMKIKQEATNVLTRTKRILTNGEQFIQATALAIVTGFSVYASHKLHLGHVYSWVLAVAEAVVFVRAFVEYIKFLDKE